MVSDVITWSCWPYPDYSDCICINDRTCSNGPLVNELYLFSRCEKEVLNMILASFVKTFDLEDDLEVIIKIFSEIDCPVKII